MSDTAGIPPRVTDVRVIVPPAPSSLPAKPHGIVLWLRIVQYVYFLRFTILIAASMVGIVYLCIAGAPSMFFNMLVLDGPASIVLVSFFAFQCAFAIMVVSRLTLFYGEERYEIPPPIRIKRNMRWWHLLLWSLLALPVVAPVVYLSRIPTSPDVDAVYLPLWRNALMAALGFALSLAWLFFLEMLYRLGSPPNSRDLFFPSKPTFPGADQTAHETPPRFGWVRASAARLFRNLPAEVGIGYFNYRTSQPRTGQVMYLALLISQSIFYLLGYFLFDPHTTGLASTVPPLVFVLFLTCLAGLGLSSLAFFFDRYRIPVSLVVVFSAALLALPKDSDHVFPLLNAAKQAADTVGPDDVLASWQRRNPNGGPLVIVTASGGGIQASAWTTQVLTGMEEGCPQRFNRSIALISAVSGGSLGTAHFVNEYGRDGFPSQHNALQSIRDRAITPALSEIAWGLVYPDFLRAVAGAFVWQSDDRGAAMEMAWRRGSEPDLQKATRGKWRDDVRDGIKPGVMFNATLAESGQRLNLATFDIDAKEDMRSFNSYYGKHRDIAILTAVRLSASFPFVSPMARPAEVAEVLKMHVADGGYYDNFGVVSALAWIRKEETRMKAAGVTRLVLLQLRAEPPHPRIEPRDWAWYTQIGAPVSALLGVRTSAQVARNDSSIADTRELLQHQGLTMENIIFQPNANALRSTTPLSWQLSPPERQQIRVDWTAQAQTIAAAKATLGCSANGGP